MAKRPTITDITSSNTSQGSLNNNFNEIETAFDNTLSLDGSTPNAMAADLDLSNNDILNVKDISVNQIEVQGITVVPNNVVTVPNWENVWLTSTDYVLNDLVQESGSTYICVEAHTSGTFSTDLALVKWQLFASVGSSGPGSGDLLASNNLLDLDSAPTALNNLGLTATASEINKLGGVTTTMTEFDYISGVTSSIQTQLDSKAPVASPALSGIPTTPTAAADTDTTQVASTAFVNNQITSSFNITGDAPLFAIRSFADWDVSSGGVVTLGGSGNVASVVRTAIGNFDITFSTAMPDTNYSVASTLDIDYSNRILLATVDNKLTTGFRLRCGLTPSGGGVSDPISGSFILVR